MCDGHDGDGSLNTPSVGSNAPRDIAAVWKKIISTMSTIILWLIIHKSRSFVHQKLAYVFIGNQMGDYTGESEPVLRITV